MQVSDNFVDTYVFYPKNVSLVSAFGKWIVFCSKTHIDTMWQKLHSVLDVLTRAGVALCMCVSTGRPNPFATHSNIGVIMIYTPVFATDEHTRKTILEVGNFLYSKTPLDLHRPNNFHRINAFFTKHKISRAKVRA